LLQTLGDSSIVTQKRVEMADVHRLPPPVTDIWDWQMRGSCRGMSSDLFFHPDRERGPARAAREARAKNVCRSCPVLAQCRAHALTVHEPYGIWGGLTVGERNEQIRANAAQTGQTDNAQTSADVAQPVLIGVDFTPTGHRGRSHGPTPDPWAGGVTTARRPHRRTQRHRHTQLHPGG
jgi:WhiB family redox-sensing transcriptional regulator